MRRTPSSGCYWGFVLCLRDTLYLFLAIAIIAYALRQIKFTQLLYFLYVSLYFLRNFYFCVFYTFFFFFLIFFFFINTTSKHPVHIADSGGKHIYTSFFYFFLIFFFFFNYLFSILTFICFL